MLHTKNVWNASKINSVDEAVYDLKKLNVEFWTLSWLHWVWRAHQQIMKSSLTYVKVIICASYGPIPGGKKFRSEDFLSNLCTIVGDTLAGIDNNASSLYKNTWGQIRLSIRGHISSWYASHYTHCTNPPIANAHTHTCEKQCSGDKSCSNAVIKLHFRQTDGPGSLISKSVICLTTLMLIFATSSW